MKYLGGCSNAKETIKPMNGFDVVLTNPPFGTKKGGERANRDDFTFQTVTFILSSFLHKWIPPHFI